MLEKKVLSSNQQVFVFAIWGKWRAIKVRQRSFNSQTLYLQGRMGTSQEWKILITFCLLISICIDAFLPSKRLAYSDIFPISIPMMNGFDFVLTPSPAECASSYPLTVATCEVRVAVAVANSQSSHWSLHIHWRTFASALYNAKLALTLRELLKQLGAVASNIRTWCIQDTVALLLWASCIRASQGLESLPRSGNTLADPETSEPRDQLPAVNNDSTGNSRGNQVISSTKT